MAARTARLETPPRPLDANYDPQKIPPYTLPDALRCDDGTRVESAEAWFERRRPELLGHFEREIYGVTPPLALQTSLAEVARDERALGGLATQLELDLTLRSAALEHTLSISVWLPRRARGMSSTPAPALLGLNLFGNQSVHPDPQIRLARGYVANNAALGIREQVATEASRGMLAQSFPVELALARGYAFATLYAGDIDPDFDDGFENGVHAFVEPSTRDARAWGSIAAWAFGLSRALDALVSLPQIDPTRVALFGHSRLGKAALFAAARDTRFALVIANSSGRGGAALSRHRFGESVRHLNQRFPHWFCERFSGYGEREHELPVDQHELLALIAPRPVVLGNAEQDLWCDPDGEWLAAQAASPVFELLGVSGLERASAPPALGRSIGDYLGYHRRPGDHELTKADFWHYLAFADRHFGP